MQYLVRTDKVERKTNLLRVGNKAEILGMIYTDFNMNPNTRNITFEDIVNPGTGKAIGEIKLYRDKNIIAVTSKKKELSAYTQSGEYREDGVLIPCSRVAKDFLLTKKEYKALESMGVTHAYFLGKESSLSQVFCFERDGNLSGVIHAKEADDVSALKGLSLVLAKRIEDQDFVFEFVRK